MYQQLGLTGARGEAEAGYPLVINHALPHYLTLLDQGLDPELALLDTLLLLMATNGDTNVASRGGEGGLRWLQREAQTLLNNGGIEPPPISIISGSSTGVYRTKSQSRRQCRPADSYLVFSTDLII